MENLLANRRLTSGKPVSHLQGSKSGTRARYCLGQLRLARAMLKTAQAVLMLSHQLLTLKSQKEIGGGSFGVLILL